MPKHHTQNPEIQALHIAMHEARKADSSYDAEAYWKALDDTYRSVVEMLKTKRACDDTFHNLSLADPGLANHLT